MPSRARQERPLQSDIMDLGIAFARPHPPGRMYGMAHQRGNEEGIMDYSKFHEGFLSLVRVLACIETGGARMKIFHRRYHAFVHSHLHTPFVRPATDSGMCTCAVRRVNVETCDMPSWSANSISGDETSEGNMISGREGGRAIC